MSVDRVERYREKVVSDAMDALDAAYRIRDGREQIAAIRQAVEHVYMAGAGWGAQDAYAESARAERESAMAAYEDGYQAGGYAAGERW